MKFTKSIILVIFILFNSSAKATTETLDQLARKTLYVFKNEDFKNINEILQVGKVYKEFLTKYAKKHKLNIKKFVEERLGKLRKKSIENLKNLKKEALKNGVDIKKLSYIGYTKYHCKQKKEYEYCDVLVIFKYKRKLGNNYKKKFQGIEIEELLGIEIDQAIRFKGGQWGSIEDFHWRNSVFSRIKKKRKNN